jgi:DNA polymerase III epsilon subunit-like protein
MDELPVPPWSYCLFDTETDGLPRYTHDEDAAGQPHVAEFGAVLLHPDLSRKAIIHHYVKPDGWEMPADVTAINGLTNEFLHENGIPIAEVVDKWEGLINQGYIFGAHNVAFDLFMMRGAMKRLGRPTLSRKTFAVCTMRMAAPIIKLPAKSGRGWKPPKLQEALTRFGIKARDGQMHTGAEDVILLQDLFASLVAAGAKIEPSTFGA